MYSSYYSVFCNSLYSDCNGISHFYPHTPYGGYWLSSCPPLGISEDFNLYLMPWKLHNTCPPTEFLLLIVKCPGNTGRYSTYPTPGIQGFYILPIPWNTAFEIAHFVTQQISFSSDQSGTGSSGKSCVRYLLMFLLSSL